MKAAFQKKEKGEQDSRRKAARQTKKEPSSLAINPAAELEARADYVARAAVLGD